MVSTAPDTTPPPGTTAVDPDGWRTTPVSARGPALIVLGIAVFLVVVGSVASVLGSGASPHLSIDRVALPGGTVVHLTPATTAMKSVVSAGQPPADILGNLAVPAGSSVVHTIDSDQGVSQFDRTVSFTSDLSSDEVVAAFQTFLPKLGWKALYSGGATGQEAGATEVLAKRGSGDGFYWEVGAVVSPTTSTGTTPYTVELFELPDDN
jgi:hypothetical protein